MKKFFYFILLLPLCCSISSCDRECSETSSAKVLSYNSVILKGFANDANGEIGFCYSATTENPLYENSSIVSTQSILSDNSYEIEINGLKPSTTYYYRAFATKDKYKILSKKVYSFTTPQFEREAVDLGLPSGLKWANCNVGASLPEEYGDYFAWGETVPKSDYSESTYKFCNGSYDTQPKYCTDSSYGTVDNKTVLEREDDAATANWGSSWRMPTTEEQDELRNKCTWTWTTLNGVNGYEVKGPNGNSIFLPAAGCRYGSSLINAGSSGYYWSSSLGSDYPNNAYYLGFGSSLVDWSNGSRRYSGLSVRPVCQ